MLREENDSSSDENMEDLGDEGECSSYVSPARPAPAPAQTSRLISSGGDDDGYHSDSGESSGLFKSQPAAKIPDSFVIEDIPDESYRQSLL